jgi:hypothetical protein
MNRRSFFAAALIAMATLGGFATADILSDANSAFRDFKVDGVPSSGVFNPPKELIRSLFARIVAKFSEPWISIADKGALMDGNTDDTAAFNAARAALCSTGGTIYIPKGGTVMEGATTGPCNGIHIKCAGPGATTIWAKTATSNVLTFGDGTPRYDLSLKECTVNGKVDVSGGSLVHVNGAAQVLIDHVNLLFWYRGLLIDGGAGQVFVGASNIKQGTPGTGRGIDIGDGTDVYLDSIVINGGGVNQQATNGGIVNASESCVTIRKTGGVLMSGVEGVLCNLGLAVSPTGTDAAKWITMVNTQFDTNNIDGILLYAADSSDVSGITITNVWSSTNDGAGIRIVGNTTHPVDGVTITGGRIFNNKSHGIDIQHAQNIKIPGLMAAMNSRVVANTNDGVFIGPFSNDIAVTLSTSGACCGAQFQTSTQFAGIGISDPTDYITVKDNNLANNLSGAISYASTGTHNVISNNKGDTTVGVAGSVTVGASPATVCAGPRAETHYLRQSATNTATVSIGGTVIGTLGAGTVISTQLAANECEVITWATTAPTYTRSVH